MLKYPHFFLRNVQLIFQQVDFYEFFQPNVGQTFEDAIEIEEKDIHYENAECNYAQHLSQNIAFSWNSLFAKGAVHQ